MESKSNPIDQPAKELTRDDIEIKIDVSPYINQDHSNSHWGAIGQSRAVKSIELGIAVRKKGYNIFVTGDQGTGRTAAVKDILDDFKGNPASLIEVAYVFNFEKRENPKTLFFKKGEAIKFKEDIEKLISFLKERIKTSIEDDLFKKKRDAIITEIDKTENRTLAEFELEIGKADFKAIQLEDDDENDEEITDILPIINGEPVEFDKLQQMVASGEISEEIWNSKREIYFSLMNRMSEIFAQLQSTREEMEEKIDNLRTLSVKKNIDGKIGTVKKRWTTKEQIEYIDSFEKDVLEHLFLFSGSGLEKELLDPEFFRYEVNVLLDHSKTDKLPVIIEDNPTHDNLFGGIETKFDMRGDCQTNFSMIKPGSLLKANGGFLLVRAETLIPNEAIWTELKRTLSSESLRIEMQPSPMGLPPVFMKPEPIPIDVKVIIIGASNLYEILSLQDENFSRLFKIPAEFNSIMKRDDKTTGEYVSFILSFIKMENLREITLEAIEELCLYGIKLAERKDLLSTQFSLIADLIRESNYVAQKNEKDHGGKTKINRKTIIDALKLKETMFNLPQELHMDSFKKHYISIPTEGSKVGSINGLAVLERGFYSFGIPMRLSAVVGAGNDGVLNIEKESGLAGDIHNKGAFILEGFLRSRFCQEIPLSLNASVCIEQSYSEIDGDSASSAELYVLLSAIGKIPLNQEIAVTGSVNQFGEIQPVGGVTEKIEGFFEVCKINGFTGNQGVMIPSSNVDAFIPDNEILDAIEKGDFHIYTIDTIDQGLAILSGLEIGDTENPKKAKSLSITGKIYAELKRFSSIKTE